MPSTGAPLWSFTAIILNTSNGFSDPDAGTSRQGKRGCIGAGAVEPVQSGRDGRLACGVGGIGPGGSDGREWRCLGVSSGCLSWSWSPRSLIASALGGKPPAVLVLEVSLEVSASPMSKMTGACELLIRRWVRLRRWRVPLAAGGQIKKGGVS